jgi:hypothetical protein
MKKEGFILCSGNIFHHESAKVKAEIINWTCGSKLAIFCSDAKGFALTHKKLVSIVGDQFEIFEKRGLKQGQEYFEVYFSIWGDARERFQQIGELITEYKSESQFVECE